MPGLANASRPVWIIDRAPGPKGGPCPTLNANASPNGPYQNNYSACTGGPGGAVTAYSNTWALGTLKPGQTATFAWNLTAVKSGTHVVNWQIAAGLNGKAKAVSAAGGAAQGDVRRQDLAGAPAGLRRQQRQGRHHAVAIRRCSRPPTG